jgi:hypothetical protein
MYTRDVDAREGCLMGAFVGKLEGDAIVIGNLGGGTLVLSIDEARHVRRELQRLLRGRLRRSAGVALASRLPVLSVTTTVKRGEGT